MTGKKGKEREDKEQKKKPVEKMCVEENGKWGCGGSKRHKKMKEKKSKGTRKKRVGNRKEEGSEKSHLQGL